MEQIVESIQDEKLIDREFLIRNIDKLNAELLKDLIFIRGLNQSIICVFMMRMSK